MIIVAIIQPFSALRYNKSFGDNVTNLTCPPYDIPQKSEIGLYLDKSSYNAIRLEIPESNISSNDVKQIFNSWKNSNILIKDNQKNIYFYEIEYRINNKTQKLCGTVCLVKIDDFCTKDIISHETTFEAPKKNRLNLLKQINCTTSPIFALFEDNKQIFGKICSEITKSNATIKSIDATGNVHKIWAVNDKNLILEVATCLKNKKLFIADGHHRYETAINYRKYCQNNGSKIANYAMMFLANIFDENLTVLPTHRLVTFNKKYAGNDYNSLFNRHFDIEERMDLYNITNVLQKETNFGIKCIGFYYKNKSWLLLKLKNQYNHKNFCYETQIFNEVILNKNIKYNKLFYTKSVDEALNLVNSNKFDGAFFMPQIKKNNLLNIFSQKILLPQKSTYFYPKPLAGLIMHEIDE